MFKYVVSILLFSATCFAQKETFEYSKVDINNSRAILIKGEIEEYNMQDASEKIKAFAKDSKEPIYLIINSPGGSVFDGYEFINTMESLREQFKIKFICALESEAASMAAIIATFCDETYMHKRSFLMYHPAAYEIGGDQYQVQTRVNFFTKYLEELDIEIANKLKITLLEYKHLTAKEYWLTPKEALDKGFIKGVVNSLYYTVKEATPPPGNFSFFGKNKVNVVTNPLREVK